MKYHGADFVVDDDAYTVERGGVQVDLEPQAMDLLLFMIERPDRLLTKAELLDNVWGDQFVGDAALTTRIRQVRHALGDDGRSQRIIKTVHGRGYRFVGDLIDLTDTARDEAGVAVVPAIRPADNIPAPRTELIGRTELLDDAVAAISTTRLVSLIGLGGAGKTTLAHEVARRCVADFPDGAWLVDLIPAHDSAGIDLAVAGALGLQRRAGASRSDLVAWLADRHMLVVLDNCEHVADQVAALCEDLLDAAGAVRILTTSREPLRVVGERRIPVGPLPIVAADGGAVDLLQAVARRYGTSIPEAGSVAAVELCRHVDGLPLAIELVGARLAVHSVDEIIERLDITAADVSGERRPKRHASLAAIIAATVAGLAAEEARLLTALARIEGRFSLDDADALCPHLGIGPGAAIVGALADRSLITTVGTSRRRHTVLETVRQHCVANDPDPDSTLDAYASWCLDSVGATLDDHYYNVAQSEWASDHYSDLLAAEGHLSRRGRHREAASLVASTGLAMHLDDGSRASHMLARVAAHVGRVDEPALAARLACTGVMTAMAAKSHRGMRDHGRAAVEAADQTDDISLQALARVLRSWAGVVADPAQALADVDAALELADQAGDQETALIATGYKIFHLAMSLRFGEAIETGLAAIERPAAPRSYPRWVIATGLMCSLAVDDPAAALRIDDEVRTSVQSAGLWGIAVARTVALASIGEVDSVIAACVELEQRLDRAGVSPLPDLLLVPAALALGAGEGQRAARYLGAVRASNEPTQSLMTSTVYRAMRSHVEAVEGVDTGVSPQQVWAEAQTWLTSLVG